MDAPYNDFTQGMKDLSYVLSFSLQTRDLMLEIPHRATLFNSPMERMAAPFLAKLGPAWFRRMLLDLVPNQRVQRLKDISDVMCANTRRIFFGKKAAFEAGDEAVKEQVASGKDIMSILREPPNVSSTVDPNPLNCIIVKANMAASEKEQLSNEEMIAQIS